MSKELKVHYGWLEAGAGYPANGSWCTPNLVRKQVTEDPRQVTCRLCLPFAQTDIQEEEFFQQLEEERENRPWWRDLFSYSRDKHLHHMLSALLGITDGLVEILTLGRVLSSAKYKYTLWHLWKECEEAVKRPQPKEEQSTRGDQAGAALSLDQT